MKYETLDVVKFQGEQEIKAKIRNEVLDSCEIHKKRRRKRPMVTKKFKTRMYEI
jgi:hypothetical protein